MSSEEEKRLRIKSRRDKIAKYKAAGYTLEPLDEDDGRPDDSLLKGDTGYDAVDPKDVSSHGVAFTECMFCGYCNCSLRLTMRRMLAVLKQEFPEGRLPLGFERPSILTGAPGQRLHQLSRDRPPPAVGTLLFIQTHTEPSLICLCCGVTITLLLSSAADEGKSWLSLSFGKLSAKLKNTAISVGKATPFLSDYMPDDPADKHKMDQKYGSGRSTADNPYSTLSSAGADSLSLSMTGAGDGPSESAAVCCIASLVSSPVPCCDVSVRLWLAFELMRTAVLMTCSKRQGNQQHWI